MVIRGDLVAAAGEKRIRESTVDDTISGVRPAWVVAPASVEEVAAVMRVAARHRATVVPRGTGTKSHWGGAPSSVDIALDLGGLAGLIAHAPGDLVVTTSAGTPLAALQEAIGAAGQRLALDPPSAHDGATVGGVLATGEAGPLRMRYGAGRDLLIGVEFVRADGTVARSGGRVVKNVAGYDLGRLLCGSYGTLGVITSATFRLHPLPAARAWVCRPVSSPMEVHDLVGRVINSPAVPSAIELDLTDGPGVLAVLVEGSPAGVAARAAGIAGRIGGIPLGASIVDEPPPWWGRALASDGVRLRLSVPVADLHAVIYALRDAAGGPVPVRGSAGTGVVHAALPVNLTPARVTGVLDAVRGILLGRGGSCVVESAPATIRDQLDIWGPIPGLDLMRRVKAQFDPAGLLSPGHFVGGL